MQTPNMSCRLETLVSPHEQFSLRPEPYPSYEAPLDSTTLNLQPLSEVTGADVGRLRLFFEDPQPEASYSVTNA